MASARPALPRCSICLEDIAVESYVLLRPCQHLFHRVCFAPILASNLRCPNCRSDAVGIDIQQSFEVESVIGVKVEDGRRMFQVKWVGYEEPTWEPLDNLFACAEALSDFVDNTIHELRHHLRVNLRPQPAPQVIVIHDTDSEHENEQQHQ